MSGRVWRAGTGLLVVVLVGAGGCAGAGSEQYRPGSVYSDPSGLYAIVLPEGWAQDYGYPRSTDIVDTDSPQRDVAFAERSVLEDQDADPRYAPRITVDVDAWGGTLAEAVDRERSLILTSIVGDDTRLTVDEPVVLPDGTPAHLLGGTLGATGIELRYLYVVNGASMITVEATGYGAEWARYRDLYDAAQRSVTTPVDAPEPTGSELSGHPAQPDVAFRDDEGAFTIVPPAGWLISVSTPETRSGPDRLVSFSEPGASAIDPPGSIGIKVVTSPSDGLSFEERIEQERELPQVYDFEYTRDEPTVLADGTPAHLFAAENDNYLLLLAMKRGELYEIRVRAATSQDGARNRAVVEAALDSLTLT